MKWFTDLFKTMSIRQKAYAELKKSIKTYEKIIKAKTDFRIFVILPKDRFKKEPLGINFEQTFIAEMIIDIIDERTINIIKSRYFEPGIYTKERRVSREFREQEVLRNADNLCESGFFDKLIKDAGK